MEVVCGFEKVEWLSSGHLGQGKFKDAKGHFWKFWVQKYGGGYVLPMPSAPLLQNKFDRGYYYRVVTRISVSVSYVLFC